VALTIVCGPDDTLVPMSVAPAATTTGYAATAVPGGQGQADDGPTVAADLEIVIPVYNEADQLAASITALRHYLDTSFPVVTKVTIADNASTDDTWRIAMELRDDLPGVDALHLDQKGRGRALRAAWSASTAAVVAYMDVDLATGLDALLPLVAPLLSGHSDLAIGTRLAPGAHVVRGVRREFISRGYNLLLRSTLRSICTDAQCGFKAMRRQAAAEVLPLVEDDEWFFDTEVLVTAQRLGLRIHEVPVDWVDDTDSRVDVVHTAWKDLRGVWRMLGPASRQRAVLRPARPPALADHSPGPYAGHLALVPDPALEVRQESAPAPRPDRAGPTTVFADEILRFAGAGVVNTVAYATLFAVLEPGLGCYRANTAALALCTLGNTAAHRGMAGSERHGLDRRERLAVSAGLLGVSLVTTTAALAVTTSLGFDTLPSELVAVTSASALAAILRFGILRTWVFRPEFGALTGAGTTKPTPRIDLRRSSPRAGSAS
jgi:putative flippase GtrA